MSTEVVDSALETLGQEIESLAVLLVTGDLAQSASPNTLKQIAAKAGIVHEHATAAGQEELAQLTAKLIERLQSGELLNKPAVTVEAELQQTIVLLQEAFAKLKPWSADARSQETASENNSLAQDPELISDFLIESGEHLSTIETQLLTLEQDRSNSEAIHAVFRAFHTIKGLAGFLEFSTIQEVAHEVETLLDKARNGEVSITPAVVDVLLESADHLKGWMAHINAKMAGSSQTTPPARSNVLLDRIVQIARSEASGEPQTTTPDLLVLSNAVENLPSENQVLPPDAASKPPSTTDIVRGSENPTGTRAGHEIRAVKVDTAKLDYLVEMVGEMVIAQSLISHDSDIAKLKSARLLRNISQAMRITGEVQKTAMAMRMVPIGQLFQRMVRLVRDLARRAGKQVELEISGEETELDRTIVEDLTDPLMHMVRNAVDHGVEHPKDRIAAGKEIAARISLRASHQGGNILIEVSDDGRGLSRDKILTKAREKGLIDEGEHLPDADVFQLIFAPGFSTAEQITDISGRGVGMDVVRKNIHKMRGRIEIQSVQGKGTTFLLKLPLTLAIIDGLVVGVGSERYIVPMFAVQETLRLAPEAVSVLPNGSEMALVRGNVIPILRLSRHFEVPARSAEISESLVIVCAGQGRRFCVVVDDLIGKQEVVIKSLGRTSKNVPGIAGGAILGDGRVGLILDMDGIFRAAGNAQ